MKKRLVSMLLCLTMATATGCGSTKAETAAGNSAQPEASSAASSPAGSTQSAKADAKPVTIEFWTIDLKASFADYFNNLIAEYEKENPNVTVNWTDVPYDDVKSKLVTATAGGQAPDVVNLNTQIALTLAGQDALVDLNQAATADQKSIYIQDLWNSAKIGDKAYAFPWYASPDIMVYNSDLLSKAGMTSTPATYDDALAQAEKFHSATGAYLFVPDEFFNMLIDDNIPILSEDGKKAAFNTKEAADMLNKYKKYTDAGILPKNNWGKWDESLKLIESGKLGMLNSSGSSISRIKDEAPDIYKVTKVAMPLVGSAGYSRNPLMNLVVPSASKNQNDAISFASYVTNDANQLAFCKLVSIFPSTTKASQDPYFTSDTSTLEGQASAMSSKASEKSRDFSLGVANQDNIQTAINKAYEAVIINGEDTQKALDQAEADVNKLLQ